MDSKVRVQLGPSPVDHEKNTDGWNRWYRFIQIKRENVCNFSHLILSSSDFHLSHLIIMHSNHKIWDQTMNPKLKKKILFFFKHQFPFSCALNNFLLSKNGEEEKCQTNIYIYIYILSLNKAINSLYYRIHFCPFQFISTI